jgi:cytochrome c
MIALGMLIACNSNDTAADTNQGNKSDTGDVIADNPSDFTQHPDYQKGLEVVAKSDCATCHDINKKLVGPSYSDVAKKYTPAADTTIERLVGKVIQGGAGVWGQVPMTPHPAMSKEDATAAVKYVLLLKDAQ